MYICIYVYMYICIYVYVCIVRYHTCAFVAGCVKAVSGHPLWLNGLSPCEKPQLFFEFISFLNNLLHEEEEVEEGTKSVY